MRNAFPDTFRILPIAIVLVCIFGFSWGERNTASAQISGTGTGWCSDYSGRNFRCDSGASTSSGGGYGGGGCATASQQSAERQIAENKKWATASNDRGVKEYNKGNYIAAAEAFQDAVEYHNSQSPRVKQNFAEALYQLGVESEDAANLESASMYYYRSVIQKSDYSDAKWRLDSLDLALKDMKPCNLCSKAIISDVGVGLDWSANFSAYALQATSNWKNCLRRFSVSCSSSAGADLYEQRRQCNQLFLSKGADAEKACIRQAHEDAQRKYYSQN